MAYAAELLDMEKMTQAKLESWNEDQEGDDFIYIHEFEIVA